MTAISSAAAVGAFPSTASDDIESTTLVEHDDTLSATAAHHGTSLQSLLVTGQNLTRLGDTINAPGGMNHTATKNSIARMATTKAGSLPATKSISQAGLEFIKSHESLRTTTYLDPAGIPTIGWGHTGPDVKLGQKITKAQAEQLLRKDVAWAENAVRKNVKVPLTQSPFDALTSFVFNAGIGNFQKSTLLRKLNKADYAGAQAEFGRWVYAKGQKLPGLVRRRAEEARMFGNWNKQGGSTPVRSIPNPAPIPRPAPGSHAANSYTVRSGDTLSGIGNRHGVSLPALQKANPQIRNPGLIYPGQKVNIPDASSSTTAPSPGSSYTVRSGDTLSGIGNRHGVSLPALQKANPQIRNPELIYPGQKVNIPHKGTVP